ncbi:hypothetical protein SAMN03080594_105203 [Arenibacter palladensis]|uniref:Uncharacterized protein n=1 Tax=Arenibacter palladensis TaxID=237373 RepID=A0A1M5CUL3_9FLAO|nr:hypothetical protein SAMN03080594_105203 [Arenibacter palladensis]
MPNKTLLLATLNCYLKGEGGVPCSRNRIPNRHWTIAVIVLLPIWSNINYETDKSKTISKLINYIDILILLN